MHIERATEDIYIFTSDRYAQVTASLIVSGNTGILIDAMPYPEEAAQIALLAHRRCPDGVRYIIYTGHEADHIYGAYLFPKAEIIAHTYGRQQILEHGQKALNDAKGLYKEFEHVTLRIPTITFEQGTFTLRLPGKTLEIFPSPGHTPDSLSVLLHEERLLFAGDTVMAVPTIARGNINQLRDSLNKVANMQLESIVQGHGEMILRGEIKEMMRRSVHYLESLQVRVQKLIESGAPRDAARTITIESCGLSRVLLNGVVVQLHIANALSVYDRMKSGDIPLLSAAEIAAATLPDTPTRKSSTKADKAAKAEKAAEKIVDKVEKVEKVVEKVAQPIPPIQPAKAGKPAVKKTTKSVIAPSAAGKKAAPPTVHRTPTTPAQTGKKGR